MGCVLEYVKGHNIHKEHRMKNALKISHPKTNMEPKNGGFGSDDFPFQKEVNFQGNRVRFFGSGYISWKSTPPKINVPLWEITI